MKIFDKSGILFIPRPKKSDEEKAKKIIVVTDCYCPQGHSLISSRVRFGNYNGIFLKVRTSNGEGYIALSPVFGDKSRISLDVDLPEGELIEILCPECNVGLPVYGKCECGGDLKVTFTIPAPDFNNCVGFCNRVGCRHAEIKNEGQMLAITASNL